MRLCRLRLGLAASRLNICETVVGPSFEAPASLAATRTAAPSGNSPSVCDASPGVFQKPAACAAQACVGIRLIRTGPARPSGRRFLLVGNAAES